MILKYMTVQTNYCDNSFLYVTSYILALKNAFEKCTSKPHPESVNVCNVYDIKEWLNPQSHDLHHHVQPHCFKFVRNEKDQSLMYYRKWSGEKCTLRVCQSLQCA